MGGRRQQRGGRRKIPAGNNNGAGSRQVRMRSGLGNTSVWSVGNHNEVLCYAGSMYASPSGVCQEMPTLWCGNERFIYIEYTIC